MMTDDGYYIVLFEANHSKVRSPGDTSVVDFEFVSSIRYDIQTKMIVMDERNKLVYMHNAHWTGLDIMQ